MTELACKTKLCPVLAVLLQSIWCSIGNILFPKTDGGCSNIANNVIYASPYHIQHTDTRGITTQRCIATTSSARYNSRNASHRLKTPQTNQRRVINTLKTARPLRVSTRRRPLEHTLLYCTSRNTVHDLKVTSVHPRVLCLRESLFPQKCPPTCPPCPQSEMEEPSTVRSSALLALTPGEDSTKSA